jgi:endogenous inhibitor of DNA gyrase (YacG/DUF329 family)
MPISDRTQLPLRAVRTTAKCPICGKPVEQKAEGQKYRPFCSKRCADVDLGRWLKEGYRVPTDDAPTEEDLGAPEPGDGPSSKR